MGNKEPKIFHVNWFQQDENAEFRWPGFGENPRVLEWILNRCRGDVRAKETSFGNVPNPGDVDLTGLEMSQNAFAEHCRIDTAAWQSEIEGIKPFFEKFGITFLLSCGSNTTRIAAKLNS